jgi:sucrose-phosphate synthase
VNRVRQHYTWESHCEQYLSCLKEVMESPPKKMPITEIAAAPGRRMGELNCLLITDIDHTLLGDDEALEQLKELIREHRGHMGFGVASGRALELVDEALEDAGVADLIDVIIASVGSEVYYSSDRVLDKGWASRLRSKWNPDRIHEALDALKFLTLQTGDHTQREFKISYDLDDRVDPETALVEIHEALARAKAAYSLIFSHGTFVDILPHRASKGKAVRYLAGKWNIPLERIATAGDSGNDIDMLTGQTAGIVVGNYDAELEPLKNVKSSRIYFADAHCAGGIIEGLNHYELINAPEILSAGA